jgi:hypothetical protein
MGVEIFELLQERVEPFVAGFAVARGEAREGFLILGGRIERLLEVLRG